MIIRVAKSRKKPFELPLAENTKLDLKSNHDGREAHTKHMHKHIILDPPYAPQEEDHSLHEHEADTREQAERMAEDGQHQHLQDCHVQGVSRPECDVWDQALGCHVDDQAPLIEELVDCLGIPPIQVEDAIAYPRDLGQSGNDIIHNHIVQHHIDIEGQGDKLESERNEGQVRVLAGRLDEFHYQDVIHEQAQERDGQLCEQVADMDFQVRVVLFYKLVVHWVGAHQVQDLLVQFCQLFGLFHAAPVHMRFLPLLILVMDVAQGLRTERPIEHNNENPITEVHPIVPDNEEPTGHEDNKSGSHQSLVVSPSEYFLQLDEDEGQEDEEQSTDEVPDQVRFDQLDHRDAEQILVLQEIEQRVGDCEYHTIHEEQDIVAREHRFGELRVRVVRVRHLEQGQLDALELEGQVCLRVLVRQFWLFLWLLHLSMLWAFEYDLIIWSNLLLCASHCNINIY